MYELVWDHTIGAGWMPENWMWADLAVLERKLDRPLSDAEKKASLSAWRQCYSEFHAQ